MPRKGNSRSSRSAPRYSRADRTSYAPRLRQQRTGHDGRQHAQHGPGAMPGPDAQVETSQSINRKRRRFTADYRVRVVEGAEGCVQSGGIGALLRREGLYSS